ncbi:MAG: hypothetical protein RL173_1029 [Fibrobacterota bacterium]|jgi:hypothetical protein
MPICEYSRPGVLSLVNGKMEITSNVWISLADLFGATGVLSHPIQPARPTLRRVGPSINLDLSAPALVRAIDITGRELLPQTEFTTGSHSLQLPASRSLMYVHARTSTHEQSVSGTDGKPKASPQHHCTTPQKSCLFTALRSADPVRDTQHDRPTTGPDNFRQVPHFPGTHATRRRVVLRRRRYP